MNLANHVVHDFPIYEDLLRSNPRWALSEGSQHFEEDSSLFKALHKIASRLKNLGIPYAVVGGMALFRHGYRRFTEDVDILVTRENLKLIHEKLDGLGYLPPFEHSKHLRDTQLGVKIEFLTTGEYPGDGKPKPISFPDPQQVSFETDGVSYINLPQLIELKLASGMTNAGRLKDLSDVLELIKAISLPLNFADQLHPFVQEKFKELWSQSQKRYIKAWRNPDLTSDVKSIDDLIANLRTAAVDLEKMQRDGITLEATESSSGIRLYLVSMDSHVAEKYGMVEEFEYWDKDDKDQ